MWVGRHIDSPTLIISFRNTGGVVSVLSVMACLMSSKEGSPKDGTTINFEWVVRYNLLLVRVWLLNPVVVHIQQNKRKIG